jgi:hypothetical protein
MIEHQLMKMSLGIEASDVLMLYLSTVFLCLKKLPYILLILGPTTLPLDWFFFYHYQFRVTL